MARIELTPVQADFLNIHLGADPDPPEPLDDQLEQISPSNVDPVELWQTATSEVDAIAKRMAAILSKTGDPNAQKIAEFGFLGLTGGNHVKLMGAILAYNGAAPSDRGKAAAQLHKVVDAFLAYIDKDPVLALSAEFPGGADLRVPMRRALTAIRKLPG